MVKPKSSSYFYILGEPVAKRTVYLGMVSGLIVLGGVCWGLYYLLLQGRSTAASEAPINAPLAVVMEEALVDPTESVQDSQRSGVVDRSSGEPVVQSALIVLLEEHLTATQLGELNSVCVNGTAAANTVGCEVTLLARRPNLYKLKTEMVGFEYTPQFGYDGQQGWFKQSSLELSQDEIEFFMRVALFESSLAHLAWSYQSEEALELGLDAVLERLPDEQWQGRDCAVVVSRSLLPFPMYHYIDLQSSEEVHRRAQLLRGSATVNVELHFMPSEAASSPRLPTGYELYFDGALHDTVKYTRVRSNGGLLSSLFEVPVTASATGLSPR